MRVLLSGIAIGVFSLTLVSETCAKKTLPKNLQNIPVFSQVSIPQIFGDKQLSNEINYIVNSNEDHADIAVFVKSMRRGDMLYTRQINKPLAPASTMKILTAEAALIFLGPDYRFSTQLLTDAKMIKDGVLQGNLYIMLSGDPSLTYDHVVDLIQSLRAHQINAIAGNVYIDNTAYDQSFYGPGWNFKDKSYCYGAPISASIINHNCLAFQVTPGKISGKAAQVIKSAKYFYPKIKNSVITREARARYCSIRFNPNPASGIEVEGCVPKGHDAWAVSYVVTDIPEYNRALFKSVFSYLSIKVYGSVTFKSTEPSLSLVEQHVSKPLKALIKDMMKKSDNVIAGALFKKIGQLYSQHPGSWENGSQAVAEILSKHAGVYTSHLRILDGSGLSPDNLTTPAQLMQVLNFAYHHYGTSFEFISSLPIAGIDGTLKNRLNNVAGRVRAKTGTISGVVSLAGYAISGDKEPLAFVIMINGNKGAIWEYRNIEDRIVTALTKYKR